MNISLKYKNRLDDILKIHYTQEGKAFLYKLNLKIYNNCLDIIKNLNKSIQSSWRPKCNHFILIFDL